MWCLKDFTLCFVYYCVAKVMGSSLMVCKSYFTKRYDLKHAFNKRFCCLDVVIIRIILSTYCLYLCNKVLYEKTFLIYLRLQKN